MDETAIMLTFTLNHLFSFSANLDSLVSTEVKAKGILKHLQMKITYLADLMTTQDYMKTKR